MMNNYSNNGIQIECQQIHLSKDAETLSSKLNLNAGVFVRASNTCKVLTATLVLFTIFAIILMSRIRALESKNEILQGQLNNFHSTLNEILVRLPILVPEENEVPDLAKFVDNTGRDENDEIDESDEDDSIVKYRVRRDVSDGDGDGDGDGTDEKQNVTQVRNKNGSFEETSEEFLNGTRTRNIRRAKDRREKGNGINRREKSSQLRNEIKNLKLKLKLSNSRRRAATADLAKTKSKFSATSSTSFSDSRAIYLIPTAPNVNINKPELELIGPWYIGEGRDFGFNDLWYRDISLDSNGTSIIFSENGLHLIYAQVYYHLTLGIGEKSSPMGYRIYIKKNNFDDQSLFRRPIPIAECVPSYPSTYYQTCFTQVAWYMEKGDQIFLKHFTKSFPMIEADRQGKTFLGIVRLSSSR